MQNFIPSAKLNDKTSTASKLFLAAVVCLLAAFLAFATPTQAFALETAKCTAQPNAESGNDIMGATETRITWEVQLAENETPTSFSLTLPEGSSCTTDHAKLTMLTGADLMTRNDLDATWSVDGQTITAELSEPATAGAYYRVTVYDVFFPANGGSMSLVGHIGLSDGTVAEVSDIPAIEVVGVTIFEQISQSLKQQDWVQAWNSNKFCKLFLDPTIMVTSFPVVFWGFLQALAIVACAFPLAIPVGFILALMRMSKFAILRGIASTYVNVVRGTPLFLQIYIAFFGLPLAGIVIPSFPLGVMVMFFNSGAYLCEIFRAGIQSISKGQFEAARSLGMNGAQTMLFVIVPQTVRRVIPTMTSEFILLYKDTSLLAAVGVMEVVMYAKTIVAATGSITPYIVAAVFYLIITLPLAKVVGILETHLDDTDGGSGKKKRKSKDTRGAKSHSTVIPERLDQPAQGNKGITPEQQPSL